jgi:hypothetical protein
MTRRKWIGVSCGIGCILVFGLFVCINRLEHDKNVKQSLTNLFAAATGGEFSFEDLKLGFFSVYLQNAKISLATHFFSLHVRDVKVDFSPWKLIRTRGDVIRSIGEVVLVAPELDLYATTMGAVSSSAAAPLTMTGGDVLSAFRGFPVDHFTIRKGIVRTVDAKGIKSAAAEDLSGSLKDDDEGVTFDLRGKIISNKKNLYVSGFFSKRGERNRLSIRLYKTTIQRSLGWRYFEIKGGSVEGVCEMSFPDSVTPETVESNGWFRLSGATATAQMAPVPVTNLNLSISLDKTLWRIDALSCRLGGVEFKGFGTWDVARLCDTLSAITLKCQGVKPETLFPKRQRSFYGALRGDGWASLTLTKSGGAQAPLKIDAGGLSLYGLPLSLRAKAALFGDSLVLDTGEVSGPGVHAQASGTLDFTRRPIAYSAVLSLSADSIPAIVPFSEAAQVAGHGTVTGEGSAVRYEATISSARAKMFGQKIIAPELRLKNDNLNRISFTVSLKNDPIFLMTGMVDGTLSKKPKISAAMTLGKNTLLAFVDTALIPLTGKIDSARVHAAFLGNADTFSVRGEASIASLPAQGKVAFLLEKPIHGKSMYWKMSSKALSVGDSLMNCNASGTIDEKFMNIDSLSIAGGIRSSGRINLNRSGYLEFNVKYRDVALSALNAWFFKQRLPLKSGTLSGNTRISEVHGRITTESDFHVRKCTVGTLTNLETEGLCKTHGCIFIVSPMTIQKDGLKFMSIDSLSNAGNSLFSGHFEALGISSILTGMAPDEYCSGEHEIKGAVSGTFSASHGGLPMSIKFHCSRATMDKWRLDSLKGDLSITEKGLTVKQFSAEDEAKVRLLASGTIPWTVLFNKNGEEDPEDSNDSLNLSMSAKGDLLKSFEKNVSNRFSVPLKGSAQGSLEIGLGGLPGTLRLTKALCRIPKGTLSAKPYIGEDIKDFSLTMNLKAQDVGLDDESSAASLAAVSLDIGATINKRPIRVYSTHKIPDGFESFKIGVFDIGMLQVTTPKHGIDVHVPGLMEPGAQGDVEFGPKLPVAAFTLSGPVDKPRITGTWIVRGGDFTFPPLVNSETTASLDPFPYIVWDLDLRAGNRKLKYYYDAGTNRKLVRLVECYVDPASVLSLRGRDMDASFKILGSLRSTKGTVYFRRTFDRNFDAGLDFVPKTLPDKKGYDNIPIIWGSAEAVSENNRLDRVKLTLMTCDSITGGISEKGRFYDIRFKMSTDAENMPGDTALNFFTKEGKRMGSVGGAGGFVSTLGEQYLHRYLLQNLEERLAKKLGLDVINVETSIASNYFNKLYNRQFLTLANEWSYLAFANVGITVGRYVLYDKVFLKWRTELVPVDTLLAPEYTMGFEFQPLSFFMMDVNYGVRQEGKSLEYNPQLIMQLRLPLNNIRKHFKF